MVDKGLWTGIAAATRSIAPVLEKGNLVILESTSPVGTTELICRWLAEERPDLTFPVGSPSGPGVGGHCIAVDPWFIVDSASERARLIRTAREVNLAKTRFVVKRATKLASKLKNPKVACLGLAFKPDIDDLRESPAVEVVLVSHSQFMAIDRASLDEKIVIDSCGVWQ